MTWISVKERLPEESGRYLAIVRKEYAVYTAILIYSKNTKAFFEEIHPFIKSYKINGITHWMELPEPPKEVS